jgi:hypothetical protein
MSDDKRIDVVVGILSDPYHREHYITREMAQAVLAALDLRAEVTKWGGARVEFLEKFCIASRRRAKGAKLNRSHRCRCPQRHRQRHSADQRPLRPRLWSLDREDASRRRGSRMVRSSAR